MSLTRIVNAGKLAGTFKRVDFFIFATEPRAKFDEISPPAGERFQGLFQKIQRAPSRMMVHVCVNWPFGWILLYRVLFLQISMVYWCLQCLSFCAWPVFAYLFGRTDEDVSIGESKKSDSDHLLKENVTHCLRGLVCCLEIWWVLNTTFVPVDAVSLSLDKITEPLKA